MKVHLHHKAVLVVLLTVIITIIITLLLIGIALYTTYKTLLNRTINTLSTTVSEMCVNDIVSYRGDFVLPNHAGIYQKDLATILWDVGGAVGSANCKSSIPSPQFFSEQTPLMGLDKDGTPGTLNGYIFYAKNYKLNHIKYRSYRANIAVFAFSGTFTPGQWNDNLRFDLVKADKLNGYSHYVQSNKSTSYSNSSSSSTSSKSNKSISNFTNPQDTKVVFTDENQAVKIHEGFYDAYCSIREQLWAWWSSHKDRVDYLYITGRSLGGALSTICAFDFAEALDADRLIHYSFAAPRIGNISFADTFNNRVPYSIRVFNTEDLVCNAPPVIWMGNDYKHSSSNLKPFTKNTGSVVDNHIDAYRDLPD